MEVADAHPLHDFSESGGFRGTVISPIAIPFVDDVVKFGVGPAGHLRILAEGVDHAVVVPRPVDVSGCAPVAPDVAALSVYEGPVILEEVFGILPGWPLKVAKQISNLMFKI